MTYIRISVNSERLKFIAFLFFVGSLSFASCTDVSEEPDQYSDELSVLNERLEAYGRNMDYEGSDSLASEIFTMAGQDGNYRALITAKTLSAISFLNRNRLDTALVLVNRVLEYSEEHATPEQIANARIQQSNIYGMMGRSAEAFDAIEKALLQVPELEDKNVMAKVYATRASVVSENNPVEALQYNYDALSIFQEEGDKHSEAISRNNIGLLLYGQGDYEKALEEYRHSLALHTQDGDQVQMAITYNNMANALNGLGDVDDAINALNDAISINRELDLTPRVIRNQYNLAQIHLDSQEYDVAYSLFSEGYESSREAGFAPGLMYLSFGLASTLYETERFEEAMPYIVETRNLAQQMGNIVLMADGWELKSALLEEKGDYQSALDAYRNYKAYADSIDENRRDREFEEVRAAYEVDMAVADNELLRQELDSQERLSKNQRGFLYVLLVALIVIGVLMIVFYRNQRKLKFAYENLEQKNNQILHKNTQLEELNQELQRLNNDKKRLMDVIVHDLRNPLFGVIGFLDVISESVEDETELMHIEMARNSAYRLNQMIDSLLEVQSLDKQNEKLDIHTTRVDELVKKAANDFQEGARRKNISLEIQVVRLNVETYAPFLNRILDNLISNALKFSEGPSRILVEVKKSGSDHWQLIVGDEGPGFTEDDKKKAFQMFAKLSAKPTNSEPSTGLGLYAVNMLVKRLMGTVWLESEQGKGSTFICEFPVEKNREM